MELTELQQLYAKHPHTKALGNVLDDPTVRIVHLKGLLASAAPLVFSGVQGGHTLFYVLDDQEQAGYFYHDLMQILDEEKVLFFPSSYRRNIKYGQRDAANEILRTEVLAKLQERKGDGVLHIVTCAEALAERVVSQDEFSDNTLRLQTGQQISSTNVQEMLAGYGFTHVDYVYEPGQFAMRGSILDVFSFSSEYPFRIDFFGDEIDSIRTFEVESQLSRSRLQEISIVPELVGREGEGVCVLDFLSKETLLVFTDFLGVREQIEVICRDTFTHQAVMTQESEANGVPLVPPSLIDGATFVERALDFRRIELGPKPAGTPQMTLTYDLTVQPIFHKNFDLVCSTLSDYLARGYQLYILADSAKQCSRLQAIFEERAEKEGECSLIPFTSVNRTLHEGFADNTLRCCFFTDHQIFDRFHKYNLRSERARGGKVALTLKELRQFEPGDYVVHIDHGVGRFGGLVRIPNGDTTQEVIKLLYQNDDVVFVSIHALHKVAKYKGKEGEPPRLNKLGTGAWERIKEKTKSKIKDIARDLIRLYARRREEKGFAYSPDSFMQHELEASFLYEDTPDQLKATQDVKADMERQRPMDRLVCGDVGFGKTEVAVRAAFKAVADNKQVAVLVPTTVLAYQHYQTFKERLKDFPCKIDYLSRARKTSDVKRILKELKEGEVNILVGTHRLVGKDVSFKDLGLLIIDEEQKFGVSVKEKLRQMKVNVDTLTLTATPIPRTLQFSLMGARDLSVIQTPPPNRYPIQTEVHTFNDEVFVDAINFEMSRGGQVFIVSNRIHSLGDLANMIHRRIPDARICIGHGQMEPEKLEQIILDFVNFDYDVLIATTIIESGIDIPNVNTIIINQAHNYGLSDLHQLRGRVGRGNRKAFCYLIAPPLASLTPEARRRLQAIENFSDLGSGIHIAMQDLDIRGAGNMLGAEQSGFIADLGYETYQKILTEAVTELKNDEFSDLYAVEENQVKAGEEILSGEDLVAECNIESDLELLFPADYIPSSSERMLLYRELDGLELDKDVQEYKLRLEDRFGKVPPEGEELMRIVPLRRLGKRLGAEKIVLKAGRMVFYFVSNPDSPYYQSVAFGRVLDYMAAHPRICNLREQNGKRSMVVKEVPNVATAVAVLQEMVSM
ncbi:MAG: transcription-repair coupling factor [Bacteroidaceae bacterium]|nr:transcription-repair coupling factor [Bacteroidaceae bacterium]